jgi:hypothetical protein
MNSREHSNIVFETVEKSVQSSQLMTMQRSMNSDASKVRVKGPGLQKAFRNQKAQFMVDTREAGKEKQKNYFFLNSHYSVKPKNKFLKNN